MPAINNASTSLLRTVRIKRLSQHYLRDSKPPQNTAEIYHPRQKPQSNHALTAIFQRRKAD
jgi:hypothetical protein